MATRKDLLKAQSFVHQRMVNALVIRDPDNPQPPLRRLRTATFIGALIGVIVMAGFGVVGLLSRGGIQTWQELDKDLVLIDTEAGAVFTYRGESGQRQLRPAANITSALLLAGGEAEVKTVKTASMKGVELLPMQGIPQAPRQLPAKDDLQATPIRLCSAAPDRGYRPITLEIGEGRVPDRNWPVVLLDDQDTEYLVYNGVSHRIHRSDEYGRSPLTLNFERIRAGNRFLNAIPTGSELKPMTVPNLGAKPVKDVGGGRMVGDVVVVGTSEDPNAAYYVVLMDGYSRITYLDSLLLRPNRGEVAVVSNEVISRSPSDTHSRMSAPDIPDGLPQPDPQNNNESFSVCATWTDPNKPPLMEVGAETPAYTGGRSPNTADVVKQMEGRGALLQNRDALSSDAAVFLVVNRMKYPVPDLESRKALRYEGAPITRVPPTLIALIPDGLPPGEALDYRSANRVINP